MIELSKKFEVICRFLKMLQPSHFEEFPMNGPISVTSSDQINASRGPPVPPLLHYGWLALSSWEHPVPQTFVSTFNVYGNFLTMLNFSRNPRCLMNRGDSIPTTTGGMLQMLSKYFPGVMPWVRRSIIGAYLSTVVKDFATNRKNWPITVFMWASLLGS
jgi:hypothetical protein